MPSCDPYGGDAPMTYAAFLTVRAIEQGANLFTAQEAVAAVLLDHPAPYPDDERHTYSGWARRDFERERR